MRSKQNGFDEPFFLAILIMVMAFLALGYLFVITGERKDNKLSMKKEGYSLISSYSLSEKSMPDVSPCIDEEFVFVDWTYSVVPSLAEADGAMCKLKEGAIKNKTF